MKKILTRFFFSNILLFIYLFMFFCLTVGVIYTSGYKYTGLLSIHFISILIFYLCFIRLKKIEKLIKKITTHFSVSFSLYNIAIVLLICTILFGISHWLKMQSIPALDAYFCLNYEKTVAIRDSITRNIPSFFNYGFAFSIKAILPFLMVYFFITKKRKLLLISSLYSFIYAASLMQKSFILTIFLPILILSLLNKKWIISIIYSSSIALGIFLLFYIANPQIRSGFKKHTTQQEQTYIKNHSTIYIATHKILKRIVILPGEVVSGWFDVFPQKESFLKGRGYHCLAPVLNKPYFNIAEELYKHLYPEYYKQGYRNQVNSASFMYEYANFGIWGLIISGFVLAIIFFVIKTIFSYHFKIQIAINVMPIFMLSSSSITTLMLSGGWGLIILLFLLFKTNLKQ